VTATTPTPTFQGRNVLGIFMAIAIAAILVNALWQFAHGDSDHQKWCHDAYVNDYAFYGQAGALSEQDYCDEISKDPGYPE
jgi:hypothetical protein